MRGKGERRYRLPLPGGLMVGPIKTERIIADVSVLQKQEDQLSFGLV